MQFIWQAVLEKDLRLKCKHFNYLKNLIEKSEYLSLEIKHSNSLTLTFHFTKNQIIFMKVKKKKSVLNSFIPREKS